MTTEAQREQHERRRVLAQDASLRDQTGTFFSHTHSDAGGRFAAVGAATVIGSTATPASAYPAASPALQVELPPEPPLGFDNPALGPEYSLAQDQCGADVSSPRVASAPSPSYRRLR